MCLNRISSLSSTQLVETAFEPSRREVLLLVERTFWVRILGWGNCNARIAFLVGAIACSNASAWRGTCDWITRLAVPMIKYFENRKPNQDVLALPCQLVLLARREKRDPIYQLDTKLWKR
jgi:hypothetical protein